MFRTIISRFRRKPTDVVESVPQHDSILKPPATRDITKLVPIILPIGFLGRKFPAILEQLEDLPFALAWAVMEREHTFFYVNEELRDFWEGQGINWRQVGMSNLERIASSAPFAGHKLDELGRPFILSLLTQDAIGPSRLLVPNLFSERMREDYRVAIPEQTCAIVYRVNLTECEREVVDGLIEDCFRQGTEPVSNERFRPERFWSAWASYR